MSAGASGYALPFTVTPPTAADLDDFEFGRRVYQQESRFYSAQPQYSDWYVAGTRKTDLILIAPLKARYVSHQRVVTAARLRNDFVIRPRVI